MKIGSVSLSGIFDFFQSSRNSDLHHNIKKIIESRRNINTNSCYNVALFIAETDGEITSKIRKSVQDTLNNGYSPKYRDMMNVGEHTLNNYLDILNRPGNPGD